MSSLSTHILDTSLGRPAQGIEVTLTQETDSGWTRIGGGVTDDDGRIKGLVDSGELSVGTYRIEFATGPYFERQQRRGFYPYVSITFVVEAPDEHYHVPLLLNPYGFSTYRGS